MSEADPELGWLEKSKGDRPTLRWAVSTDSPLMDFAFCRETGETVAADSMGGLTLLDRRGNLKSVNRGFENIQMVRWSDSGDGGAIVIGENTLVRVRQSLALRWSLDLPASIMAFDVDPYGNHVVVSLANKQTRIYDWNKKRVAEFETIQPLNFIRFVATEKRLVGCAEYGLIGSFSFAGDEIWSEKLWTNVGDLAITGNGKNVLIAGFNHGVQVYDANGNHRGSYMMEGSPGRVSSSFVSERVAACTIERHLYWLDSDGEMLWAAAPDTDVVDLHVDALGNGMVLGLDTGKMLRLSWDDASED